MKNKILISILAVIVFLSFNTFSYAVAIDNNCPLNVIHILQVTPALLCLEERIDTLENAPVGSGSGEANTASNLGSIGEGWFAQKVAVDLQFKKIVNGTGIIINSNGTRIMINSTITGSGVFQPHTLLNSTAHTDTVTQSPTRGSIVYGDSTPKWNELLIGTAGRYLKSDGTDTAWNYLKAQTYTGTQALSLTDEIVICSGTSVIIQLPDGDSSQNGKTYVIIKRESTSTCTLNTVGSDVFYDGSTSFIMRNQWETVTVSQFGANTWYFNTMSVDAKNIGSTGEGVYTSKDDAELQFKKLLGTSPIGISSNSTNISIACSTCIDVSVGQLSITVFVSLVKTNIGNAYADIYISPFDEENMSTIDCTGVTEFRISYMWDYVGTGTQQLRWVDVSNNTNVLYESPPFTIDRDPTNTNWVAKPAWCTGIVSIEQQGKSTTAGDDPVAKGYNIHVR